MGSFEEILKDLTPDEQAKVREFIEYLLWKHEKRLRGSTSKENEHEPRPHNNQS